SDSAPHPIQSKEDTKAGNSAAAGCFTQGWTTALVIRALENAIAQSWIKRDQVTQEVIEGFLCRHGRAFYQLAEGKGPATHKPRIRLERRGETIPKSIKSADGNIEIVPFRRGQELMSLSWID
ncbi:MAG: hypothetical protein Q9174_007439, partial [Haloplaca sp. 1 TL-2023]